MTVATAAPATPPAECDDEQQVEPDVQHRRKQQEQQRRDRVAQTAQERADKVIEQLRACAAEDDRAVGKGRSVDLGAVGRDVDPREQRVEQHQRQRRQKHRQRRREDDLRRQRAAHARLIPRADTRGRHHAEARAHAEGELQEDRYDRGRVVHTRDLPRRERLADDGRVADGIDLLQQIRQDHRRRERQDRPPAGALCQIARLKERAERFPKMVHFHRKIPVNFNLFTILCCGRDYSLRDFPCQVGTFTAFPPPEGCKSEKMQVWQSRTGTWPDIKSHRVRAAAAARKR